MGLGTTHNTVTTAAVFIPEVWKDEVIVAREKNLVASKLFWNINHKGKKGDTLHVPNISNLSANDKTAETEVTLQAVTESEISISINKHKEVSMLFEDITMLQQAYELRQLYTNKAGYALAKQMDTDLLALGAGLNGSTAYSTAVIGSDGTTVWDGSANTNTGNGAALADAGLRKAIQTLEENDVPGDELFLLIPPSEKAALLGIDKFTLFQNYGSTGPVQKGRFGQIYGVDVYVTTNLPQVTADDTTTDYNTAILAHKEALAIAMQQDVRVQTQYKQEYLGWLVTTDVVYGVKEMRDDHGLVLVCSEA